MTNTELLGTISEAYFALAGYRSPSHTPEQQEAELARCHDLLAAVVYAPKPTPTDSVPLCTECVSCIGGATGEPDFTWHPANPNESCGADDHE